MEHAEALRPLIPAGMTMPDMAMRFILSNPDVSTVIPGMRKIKHVDTNIATSEAGALEPESPGAAAPASLGSHAN